VRLMSPAIMFVVGFPPMMMVVMLVMNTVERRLTGPGRPALRVVDGGVGVGPDGPAASAAPPPAGSGPAPARAVLRLVTSAEHDESGSA
jgi:hypothetical protein